MLRKTMCLLFFVTLLSGCVSEAVNEFTEEKLLENAAIQDEEGMPYMNPSDFYYTYDGYNPELYNPWDTYNLLDSVIILTIDDMKGVKTFIDGDVYSFVNKEGRNTSPARLPVRGQEPDVAHLYVSKTTATEKLKKDDVIALEAVFNQPHGAMQKIVRINITGEVVHLITRAPQPDEMWGTARMKE